MERPNSRPDELLTLEELLVASSREINYRYLYQGLIEIREEQGPVTINAYSLRDPSRLSLEN